VESQATDRAFCIGQKKNVEVHSFLCSGTVEEHIDELIERKKEVAGSVVGAGEAWLSELSNTEIRKLFQLRAEVQGE
jgi:SNF2 family DNA or RNA helicase